MSAVPPMMMTTAPSGDALRHDHYGEACDACAAEWPTPAPLDVKRLARALRDTDPHEQFYIGAVQVNAVAFATRLARAYAQQDTPEPTGETP